MLTQLQSISQTITLTLLHLTWMLLIVLAVHLLTQRCLVGRAKWQYHLGLLNLLACYLAIPLAVLLVIQSVDIQPSSPSEQPAYASVNQATYHWEQVDSSSTIRTAASVPRSAPAPVTEPPKVDFLSEVAPTETGGALPPSVAELNEASSPQPWYSVARFSFLLTFAYLAGVLGMSLRLFHSGQQCQRILNTYQEIPAGWVDLLAEQAKRLGCHTIPALAISHQVISPVLMGILRPTILIPASLASSLTPDDLESILLHELAHLKRNDHLVLILQRLSETIFFFHPAIWWISRDLDLRREECCDDTVLRAGAAPLVYAKALLKVAQSCSSPQVPSGWSLAATDSPSHLVRRIRRILREPSQPLPAGVTPVLTIALLVCLSTTGWALSAYSSTDSPQDLSETETRQSPARYDFPEAFDQIDGGVLAILRGEVFLPDGSPCNNFKIKCLYSDRKITYHENRFQIREGNSYPGIEFFVCSNDQRYVKRLRIDAGQTREMARSGLRVMLEPSIVKQVPVTVTRKGQPVAGAHVSYGPHRFVTDQNGEVSIAMIQQDPQNHSLFAWTDDHLVGGSDQIDGERGAARWGEDGAQISLVPCETLTVKVVDKQGQPVADYSLATTLHQGLWAFQIPLNEIEPMVTDKNGIATTDWCPTWETRTCHLTGDESANSKHPRVGINETVYPMAFLSTALGHDTNLTFEVARPPARTRIHGNLDMVAPSKAGFLIEFYSFQGPNEGVSERTFARTDEEGHIVADVLPGITYDVHLLDQRWTTPEGWQGVLVDSKTDTVTPLNLNAKPGVPVEIRLTEGANRRPLIRDVVLNCSSPHSYTFQVDGKEQSAIGGRRWSQVPDESGVVRTLASSGKLKIYLRSPNWLEEFEFLVEEGTENIFQLHNPDADQLTFSGRLTVPDNGPEFTDLHWVAYRNSAREQRALEGSFQRDGSFQFEATCTSALIAVHSSDRAWAGFAFLEGGREAEIVLQPAPQYHGQLVDPQGNPIANHQLQLKPQYPEYHEGKATKLSRIVRIKTETRNATTDDNGYFHFENLAPGFGYRMYEVDVTKGRMNSRVDYGRYLGERYFAPGENRPPQLIQLGTTPSQRSLSDRIKSGVQHCRRMDMNLLVLSYQSASDTDAVAKQLQDDDANRAIYSYLPLVLSHNTDQLPADAQAAFQHHNWPLPTPGQVFLAILDGQGNELYRQSVSVDDGDAIREMQRVFEQLKPPVQNAREKLDKALAEAKASNRKVWVTHSQTRCNPCFLLARWIEEHRETLEKDYVMVKFDDCRDEDGISVCRSVIGEREMVGVPAFFILDETGNEIGGSIGPMGNFGYPNSYEGVSHLRQMLETTGTRITAEERQEMTKPLLPHSPESPDSGK